MRPCAPSKTRAGAGPPRPRPAAQSLRRRREAVAPEGHRSGPRGLEPLAAVGRRRHHLRADASPLHGQGQPQGAAGSAAQRAVRARRARVAGRVRCFLRRAVDQARSLTAERLGSGWQPILVLLSDEEEAAGKSFRNLSRVAVMPVSNAGVADLMWAASLLVLAGGAPCARGPSFGAGAPTGRSESDGSAPDGARARS